jgi:LacI family transcriptional regulator
MRATIKDIAKALDVNVGTVSRALNDKPGVSPDLRKKIVRKAADLSYRPNGHARGLVTQRTETIGLLSGVETSAFLSNPFYAGVFAGIEAETRDHNFALMFASATPENPIGLSQLPKFIVEHRVDGLLVVGAVEPNVVELLKSYHYPFVMVDYHLPDDGMDTVVTNNIRSARVATEHLLQLGHRHIGFVGGSPLDRGNFFERLQGYREALEGQGIKYRDELVRGTAIVSGYDSAMHVLDVAPEVTALVGCNDANALAAMGALRARKLEVPKDISVVGFDDIPAAAEAWPPLTTMRVDKWAMGRKAAQRLLQKLSEGDTSAPHQIVFSADLVPRGSTAAARKA